MAKKDKAQAQRPARNVKPVVPQLNFPELALKENLEYTVLLDDQILLLDNFFSAEECKRYVKFIDELPLELTPPKKRGEADRVNYRTSVTSVPFAQRLYDVISPHLPALPCPPSMKKASGEPRKPHSLNSNVRLYKYSEGQYFGPHYDDSVRDTQTGSRSEWTLLIYLTGAEDGVKGGETLFYKEQRGKAREVITPPLSRGMALLHRHGHECMLHEGSPVLAGTKYVLRSDLMFMN